MCRSWRAGARHYRRGLSLRIVERISRSERCQSSVLFFEALAKTELGKIKTEVLRQEVLAQTRCHR